MKWIINITYLHGIVFCSAKTVHTQVVTNAAIGVCDSWKLYQGDRVSF
jgi:hypothetical protein